MIRGPRTFTFENQNSLDDFKIIVNKVHRPILPALRPRKLIIPGKDGAWDFGNNTYEELPLPIDCTIVEPLDDVSLTRAIAIWLSKKGKLIISDEPEKYYMGRVYETFTPDIIGPAGKFTLNFICDPFAYSISETTDEILLGDDIPLGNSVTLGNADNYTYHLTESGSISVDNFGTRNIRPTIIINGSFDGIEIAMNGKSIEYAHVMALKELILDGSNYTVELDGVNKLSDISGDIVDFLTLQPGENIVTITGTNMDCTIQFEFRPMFY